MSVESYSYPVFPITKWIIVRVIGCLMHDPANVHH